jgi:DNA-cytosine methyltransferase
MDKTMNKGVNVLSLFDGISCGQIALERAGIKVNKYFASEIDKNAIKVTQHNWPKTVQLSSVLGVKSENLPDIHLVIGGSPCQGFSFAGKQSNFSDPRSKLFFEYVRILDEVKEKSPNVYFLLENVKMKKENEKVITKILGVEPIEINSALVSAQNRKRLYWTNIPNVKLPKDKNIVLYDILEIKLNMEVNRRNKSIKLFDIKGGGQGNRVYSVEGKSICLSASSGGTASSGNMLINIPQNQQKYLPEIQSDFIDPYNKKNLNDKSTSLRTNGNNGNALVKYGENYRNLTRFECERLQTVNDGYTNEISDSKAKKALGNGWTVDVIAHIFSFLPDEFKNNG